MEIYSVQWKREYMVKGYDDYYSDEPGLITEDDQTICDTKKFASFDTAKEYAIQCAETLTALFELEKKSRYNQNIDNQQKAEYTISNKIDVPSFENFFASITVYHSKGGDYSSYASYRIEYSVYIRSEYVED